MSYTLQYKQCIECPLLAWAYSYACTAGPSACGPHCLQRTLTAPSSASRARSRPHAPACVPAPCHDLDTLGMPHLHAAHAQPALRGSYGMLLLQVSCKLQAAPCLCPVPRPRQPPPPRPASHAPAARPAPLRLPATGMDRPAAPRLLAPVPAPAPALALAGTRGPRGAQRQAAGGRLGNAPSPERSGRAPVGGQGTKQPELVRQAFPCNCDAACIHYTARTQYQSLPPTMRATTAQHHMSSRDCHIAR